MGFGGSGSSDGMLAFYTGTTEKMRLDNNGRLAFGGVSNNTSYDTNAHNILLANGILIFCLSNIFFGVP